MAQAGLTTVFGQAMSFVTMSLATGALLDRRQWLFWATGATAVVAFLSDAGSLTTLAGTLAVSAVLLIVFGSRNGRRAGFGFGIALVAAAALAAVLPSQTLDSMPPAVSLPAPEMLLSRGPAGLALSISSFGWPFFLLAALGVVVNVRAGRFDDWWLLVWGWLLGTSALILVDAFRGQDVRHYYAAMPAVAVFAAIGVVTLWNAGGQRRALAVATSALGAALGVIGWLGVLGPALE
jgi:hypothetical protein